jgi:hypothetical protein
MRIGALVLLLALAGGAVRAQGSIRASLTGAVRDKAGGAIRDAQVVLQPIGRSAVSNERGSFRFGNLASGHYTVVLRRIGFLPVRMELQLAGRDTTLDVVLQPLPLTLTKVLTSATRIGLNGVVLDSAGIAVADADVRAIPASGIQSLPIDQRTHHQTRTDKDGVFFLPLVGGGYELRVVRAGKGITSSPVFVPRTGSRCVIVGFAFPDELLAQESTCRALSDSAPRDLLASDPD